MQGIWDSGTRGWAEYEKAMSGTMDLPTEFVVYYPPVSNELHGDLPAEYVKVSVDWMEVETHKRIYVKVGDNGEWMTYSYAGETEETLVVKSNIYAHLWLDREIPLSQDFLRQNPS